MNVAMVGCGQVADLHATLLAEDRHRLSWVIGRVPDKAADFAARHGFERHGVDLAAAIEDPEVDAIFVCTPNECHAAQTRAALEADKHVLVEIPLAMSYAEGQALATMARERRLTLQVGHNHRYLGGVRWIRDQVSAGELTIHSVSARYYVWRRENIATNGYRRSWTDDLLWHHGQHSIDVVLWLLGVERAGDAKVSALFASPHPKRGGPMDITVAVRAPTNQVGSVQLSYNSFINLYDYVIAGEEETFIIENGAVRTRDGIVYDYRSDQAGRGDGARREQNREFFESIQFGRRALTSAEAVLPTLDVLQRAQDSQVAR